MMEENEKFVKSLLTKVSRNFKVQNNKMLNRNELNNDQCVKNNKICIFFIEKF